MSLSPFFLRAILRFLEHRIVAVSHVAATLRRVFARDSPTEAFDSRIRAFPGFPAFASRNVASVSENGNWPAIKRDAKRRNRFPRDVVLFLAATG